jgi:hypothetical protein
MRAILLPIFPFTESVFEKMQKGNAREAGCIVSPFQPPRLLAVVQKVTR